jgi:hypothetical protein
MMGEGLTGNHLFQLKPGCFKKALLRDISHLINRDS